MHVLVGSCARCQCSIATVLSGNLAAEQSHLSTLARLGGCQVAPEGVALQAALVLVAPDALGPALALAAIPCPLVGLLPACPLAVHSDVLRPKRLSIM